MGHMRIGPQYYPPRRFGVQVIQRGPHGARFATDPAQPGGGFKWWSEQLLDRNADAHWWKPQQQVVGVLGLGALGALKPEATPRQQIDLTAQARSLRDQATRATLASAPGLELAIRASTAAVDGLMPWEVGTADTVLGWVGLRNRDSSHDVRANLQAALSNLRIATGAKEGRMDTGPKGSGSTATDFVRNVASEQFARDVAQRAAECKADPVRCAKNPTGGGAPTDYPALGWGIGTTVAALGAGALLLYSLGSGYGKGLAGRSTSTKKNPGRRRRSGR